MTENQLELSRREPDTLLPLALVANREPDAVSTTQAVDVRPDEPAVDASVRRRFGLVLLVSLLVLQTLHEDLHRQLLRVAHRCARSTERDFTERTRPLERSEAVLQSGDVVDFTHPNRQHDVTHDAVTREAVVLIVLAHGDGLDPLVDLFARLANGADKKILEERPVLTHQPILSVDPRIIPADVVRDVLSGAAQDALELSHLSVECFVHYKPR